MLRNRDTCGKLKGIHGLLYHSYLSLVPLASLSYVMAVVGLCDMMFLILTVPECFADCRGGERCPRGDRAMEGDAGMSLLYA